jgi:preprotein translocase subunit SecA
MGLFDVLNRLLGDPNEKELKRVRPIVAEVRKREQQADIRALTREDLPKKTDEMKARSGLFKQEGFTTKLLIPSASSSLVALRA